MGPDRVNLLPQFARKNWTVNILTHTVWIEEDNITPKISSPPQLPTIILDNLNYPEWKGQAYNTEKMRDVI